MSKGCKNSLGVCKVPLVAISDEYWSRTDTKKYNWKMMCMCMCMCVYV